MSFQHPFKLGKLELSNNILYAPLAGCSDLPFRKMAKKYEPGLIFCEMVKMDALVRNDPNTFKLLDYEPNMHPIGAQLCGSKVELAAQSAKIIEDLGFDVLDLNCGCPVDKVTKDGSGSALLLNPEKIAQILHEMIRSVNIPVTLKIRTGYDEEHINALEIVKIAEQVGAKAISIHGRTRKQAYKGLANRDLIREAKSIADNILVFGNGDIFDVESAKHMFDHTHCDGILIARGTMGNPWIADDIRRSYLNLPIKTRTPKDLKQALLNHFDYILQYKPEKKALLDMRRVGCWYLKNCVGVKSLRSSLMQQKNTKDMVEMIETFAWSPSNEVSSGSY